MMSVRAYVVVCLALTFWVTLLPRNTGNHRQTSSHISIKKGKQEMYTTRVEELSNVSLEHQGVKKRRPVGLGVGQVAQKSCYK